MSMREMPLAAEARLAMFEVFRPSLARLREGLSSGDPAEVLAAAQALVRRADEGEDDPSAIAGCLPEKLFSLPGEMLAQVAELGVRGVPIAVPELPEDLPPALAARFRCVALLASPERLAVETASPMDLAAVNGAPVDRAITSGLWKRMASHKRPSMHDVAIRIARAGIEGALLAPEEAQAVLVDIARRSVPAVAARAVGLLAEPWAHALPCPPLEMFAEDAEVALAVVHLAAARGEIEGVRRAVWNEAWLSVRRAGIAALGALGEREDVEALVAAAEEEPSAVGADVVRALVTLKRRGISTDDAQARGLLALVLAYESIPLDAAAEALSSRADTLVAAIEERLAAVAKGAPSEARDAAASGGEPRSGAVSKARVVAFLQALGTRRAITRLVEMAADGRDGALSAHAIRALGSLDERGAEGMILSRLTAEPEACLFALRRIGGALTAERLRAVLAGKPPPWLWEALGVLLRIDPSPDVLGAAADHQAISSDALEGLPAYLGLAQTDVLARIAQTPGHPLRRSAIGALGHSGGPAAIDPLGALLTDADEEVRELATGALRSLGPRLAGPDPSLACLEGAEDPAATIVAEAALRRLTEREVPASDAVLLLDVLIGCAHPHLVRRARPLLRRANPEIKKRAIACLAAAGPASASWLLPSLDDERLPVARQALIALGRAAVPGLGIRLARWLAHPNMNLKKTAAEALAACGATWTTDVASRCDQRVIQPIVEALGRTDQPGYRALLEQALQALAGPFHRSILVSSLVAASRATGDGARGVELLASSLAGAFAAEELAALVVTRPEVPQALLTHAVAAATGRLAGQLDRLNAALSLRGAAHRIPREGDVAPESDHRPGLARADASRRASALRRRVREAPFHFEPSADLVAAVRSAADPTHPLRVDLTASEQRVLSGLLGAFDDATRAAAIGLLAGARDPSVIERVLPHLDVGGEVDPRHAAWLSIALARRGPEAARSLADHADPEVRRRAGFVLAITGEDDLRRAPPKERAAALEARYLDGRTDAILSAMEGPGALSPREVAQTIAERCSASGALALVDRWVARAPADRGATLVDLEFLGDVLAPKLRALVTEDLSGDARRRAIGVLASRRAIAPKALRSLLHDTHPSVRDGAARALLDLGDRADRDEVLGLWLAGALRDAFFPLPVDAQDLPAFEAAVRAAGSEWAEIAVLDPIAALPSREAVPLLLVLRDSPHTRVSGLARDALRRLPASVVLPALREGDPGWLDVIGGLGALPPALADLVGQRGDREVWMDFLQRFAGFGALYAGGLGERIAAWAAEDPSRPNLRLVTRLTDWFDPVRAEKLVHHLAPALSGARRDTVLQAVMEALRERPPSFVARILSRIVTPADTEAVQALAEAEAQSPGVLDLLPPALAKAVVRALDRALETADPEAARKLLTYFASRAERPAEREATIAMLEQKVGAPSPRVSLHAHRLLRTLAPKERYLRATRKLLESADPGTVRLAVRVLSFGGDVESVGAIAERLLHPHAAVTRAAREGLLALGAEAIAGLERARGKLRPDRREPIDAVLVEIRERADRR